MRHCRPAIALAFALLVLCPRSPAAQTSPDFLFGSPKGMIGVRSGWVFASANSDLFTFVQRSPHRRSQGFQRAGDRRRRRNGDHAARRARSAGSISRRRARTPSIAISSTISGCRSRRRPGCARLNLSGSVKFAHDAPRPRNQQPRVDSRGGHAVRRRGRRHAAATSSCSSATSSTSTARTRRSSPTRSARTAGRRARTCSAASTCGCANVFISAAKGAIFGRARTPDRDFIDFDPIDLAGFKRQPAFITCFRGCTHDE